MYRCLFGLVVACGIGCNTCGRTCDDCCDTVYRPLGSGHYSHTPRTNSESGALYATPKTYAAPKTYADPVPTAPEAETSESDAPSTFSLPEPGLN